MGQADAPLVVNGWSLHVYPEFADRWERLRREVEAQRRRDPQGYIHSATAKVFAALRRLVLSDIPADPASARFRQGGTLGGEYRHWRRARFLQRFRLFFRYHGQARIIVYVWLNDEHTLRKSGARTDPYRVFRDMLRRGRPPTTWEDLLSASPPWAEHEP